MYELATITTALLPRSKEEMDEEFTQWWIKTAVPIDCRIPAVSHRLWNSDLAISGHPLTLTLVLTEY